MGKYIRKSKLAPDVALMDLCPSTLGVRTRAKTLALQRSSSSPSPAAPNPDTTSSSSFSYLQLRSRRLQKPRPLLNEAKKPHNPCPKSSSRLRGVSSGSTGSVSLSCKDKLVVLVGDGCFGDTEVGNVFDVGVESSFAEDNWEFDNSGRNTRETTPCSLIRDSDAIGTPGSTTRRTSSTISNQAIRNDLQRNIPTTREMEDFFACVEQQQQRLFIEKYNFDFVNDMPLPGRFEWVQVMP